MWNYLFKPSGPTFSINATNLLHLKSHLINSRIRSICLVLWLIHVNVSPALSCTDHGKGSSTAAWYLGGCQDAVGMGRVLLWYPDSLPESIHCQ